MVLKNKYRQANSNNWQLVPLLCLVVNLSGLGQFEKKPISLNEEVKTLESIAGKKENRDFLYVTAGNTLYSIGDQNGNFPEVGFHVEGEMGGVWQHPIKLLDGFELSYREEGEDGFKTLDQSDRFLAYPFANQFLYYPDSGISIERTDFVTDSLPVLVVEYRIKNRSSQEKKLQLNLKIDSDLSPVWLGDRTRMIDGQDVLFNTSVENAVMLKDSLNDWYTAISF